MCLAENTSFPEIRSKMAAQVEAAPDEPFTEFLLYALGRFDEAVEVNPESPIHTVLLYGRAHWRLRQAMAVMFNGNCKGQSPRIAEQTCS